MRAATLLAAAAAAPARGGDPLRDHIEAEMQRGHIPGASVAVIRRDELLWAGAFGSAAPNETGVGAAVTNDTRFMFASTSKTIIATAVMLLADKGWIDVAADVGAYLPFAVRNPRFPDAPITVHSLLTHTSSISDDMYDLIPIYMAGDSTITLHDFLSGYLVPGGQWYRGAGWNYARSRPPSSGGNGTYDYSNVGACLAAYVAECVARRHGFADGFDDLARRRVFAPLGAPAGEAGYALRDFGTLEPPAGALPSRWGGARYRSCAQYSVPDYPTCDWRGSAQSYARLFSMYANYGMYKGVQLLKRETVEWMRARPAGYGHDTEPNRPGATEYPSNALFLWEKGLVDGYEWVLGHDGGDVGIATEAWMNASSGVGFVMLFNADWGQSGARDLVAAIASIETAIMTRFDAAPPRPPSPAPGAGAADAAVARRFGTRRYRRRRGEGSGVVPAPPGGKRKVDGC